jgi:hypothetical protein
MIGMNPLGKKRRRAKRQRHSVKAAKINNPGDTNQYGTLISRVWYTFVVKVAQSSERNCDLR